MVEESKANETKVEEPKKAVGKMLFKYLLGIIFVALGAFLLWACRGDFWTVVKGCIGPFLILAGAITIAIAKE